MKLSVYVTLSDAILNNVRHGEHAVEVDCGTLSDDRKRALAALAHLEDNGQVVLCDFRSTSRAYGIVSVPRADEESVVAVLDRWLAMEAQEKAAAAEKEAAKQEEAAERRAEAERQAALPVKEQVSHWHSGQYLVVLPLRNYDDLSGPAMAEAARASKEWHERERACEAAKKARLAAEKQEQLEWIEAHGSARLKRLVAEKIECDGVYRSERLSVERPGWRYSVNVPGEGHEPRNATEEALALLDEARKTEPTARLKYWVATLGEEDEDGYVEHEEEWRGYVAIADCPWDKSRDIMFGGPEA